MTVEVIYPWRVVRHSPLYDGRTYHGRLEDPGVLVEQVFRVHLESVCPAGTDCSLGTAEAGKQKEGAS